MGKGQKSNQAIKGQQSEPRRGKSDQADKQSRQGDRSQRDQLDDQGRQRHMGHGDQAADQGNRRPFAEGDPNEDLGRPVRVGLSEIEEDAQDRKNPGQWEDKTEGTSRP
jgi:hypothetical protein